MAFTGTKWIVDCVAWRGGCIGWHDAGGGESGFSASDMQSGSHRHFVSGLPNDFARKPGSFRPPVVSFGVMSATPRPQRADWQDAFPSTCAKAPHHQRRYEERFAP